MIDGLIIRIAEINDLNVLVEFNKSMALETEDLILDVLKINAGVRAILENESYGYYLVAEKNNVIIGALMVTKEWSDWRNGFFWWIQSVYIKHDFRKQGIYKELYNFVKQLALKENNVVGFRLYVEKNNEIARKVYESLGMEETHYYMYEEICLVD